MHRMYDYVGRLQVQYAEHDVTLSICNLAFHAVSIACFACAFPNATPNPIDVMAITYVHVW
jgi:hypothetical protein